MFKIPTWLVDKIKTTFPDEKALHIEVANNPDKIEDTLRGLASRKFSPNEIVKAFEDGRESLLIISAKQCVDKWSTFKLYQKALHTYREKNQIHA